MTKDKALFAKIRVLYASQTTRERTYGSGPLCYKGYASDDASLFVGTNESTGDGILRIQGNQGVEEGLKKLRNTLSSDELNTLEAKSIVCSYYLTPTPRCFSQRQVTHLFEETLAAQRSNVVPRLRIDKNCIVVGSAGSQRFLKIIPFVPNTGYRR